MNESSRESPWFLSEKIAGRAVEIMRQLPALPDASIVTLVAAVARRAGKPIKILPVGNESWQHLTGLTLDYGSHYAILVRPTDGIYYQIHCVLHELAHLLFDHVPTAAVGRLRGQFTGAEVVHVRLIDAEDSPLDVQAEGEAEYLAHLLGELILRPRYAHGEEVFG